MKALINERDMDRLEVEADVMVTNIEKDFLIAYKGTRVDGEGKNRTKPQQVKQESADGKETRLLE